MEYEMVIKEDNNVFFGISLGTVYDVTCSEQIKLYNIGYLPRTKEIYYNQNIHLPNGLISYLNGRKIDSFLKNNMKEFQIFSKEEYEEAIKIYKVLKITEELVKCKIISM